MNEGGRAGGRVGELRVELTEGAIRVLKGDRVLTLTRGSAPPDAEDTPDFVVLLDEISFWDAPHGDDEIEMTDLQKIVEMIEDTFDRHGLTVAFE